MFLSQTSPGSASDRQCSRWLPRCEILFAVPLLAVVFAGCGPDQTPAGSQNGVQPLSIPEAAGSGVGDIFPYTRFVDRDGQVVDLAEATDSKQSLLVFMRGFSGFVCPYCTEQTAELVKRHDEIRATNTELFIVYPGPAETIPKFLEAVRAYMKSEQDLEPTLSVLMDVDLKAVDALGIRQNLSLPCTFVLDADGTLVYEYKGNSPPDRPSLDEVLRVLEAASHGSQTSGE